MNKSKEEVALLIRKNQGWIRKTAMKFASRLPHGMTLDDLIHEAEYAFMRAAQQHDPTRTSITTYSYQSMINHLVRYLTIQHRRGFTNVGDGPGKTSAIENVKILQGGAPAHDDDDLCTLLDTFGEEEPPRPTSWTKDEWNEILRYLPQRQARAVWCRHVLGWNLQRVGDELGVSRERVRQLVTVGLNKIVYLVRTGVIRCQHIMEHA